MNFPPFSALPAISRQRRKIAIFGIISSCAERKEIFGKLFGVFERQLSGLSANAIKNYIRSLFTHLFLCPNSKVLAMPQLFFLKYTATHEKVARSAPTREPNDRRDLTLTPDKKIYVAALPAKKGYKLKKQLKKAGEAGLVPLVCYKGRRKEVITETSE